MSDLGSGNGTLINDRDEDGTCRLAHGDKLELGNTVLVFECTGLSQPSQPHGKWPDGHLRDEDARSTVAGRPKAGVRGDGGAVPPPFPRAASHPGGPPPPPLPRPAGAARLRPSTAPPAARGSGIPASIPPIPRPLGPPAPPSQSPIARAVPMPGSPSPMRGARPVVPPAPTVSTDAAIAAMTHRSPPPPHAGGFSPFPGPLGAVGTRQPAKAQVIAYPSAPAGFAMSPTSGSSPRFQYPNGVMAPLPAGERRRVLIGILGAAFVAVGVGIVMALFHGGGGREQGSSRNQQASAAKMAQAAPPAATPPAAIAASTGAGQSAPGQASSPALDQLYGDHELRPSDFGTDEQFLADTAGGPASGSATASAATPSAATASAATPPTPARTRAERRSAQRSGRTGRDAEDSDHSEDAAATSDEEKAADVGAATGATGALRKAESLYRQKKFAEAATHLRDAAESASATKREGARMRTLAVNYAKIGSLMDEGQEFLVSDAPRALQAFKNALRLDEQFGDSVHDRAIGARIAQVAPTAAGAYMARKDYPEAKAAADIADKFGSGASDRVRGVRGSLERKAAELYIEARKLADAGQTEQAAETARLIIRMVPRSSDLYPRAARLAGQ